MQRMVAGNDHHTIKKDNYIFDGKGGVEALLFVTEQFRKNARKLQYEEGWELFDNYEEVLQGTALDKWEQITNDIDPDDRTPERFNEVIDERQQGINIRRIIPYKQPTPEPT